MINRTTIHSLCNNTTYKRGLDIYRSNHKISAFKVEEAEKEEVVSATVQGSTRGRYYSVKIKYNKEKECLQRVFCDCPAFQSYAGICKHCAAVLLEYSDYQSRQRKLSDYEQKDEESAYRRKRLADYFSAEKQTTVMMKRLLEQQHQRRKLPVLQKDTFEKVQLVPYLKCSGKSIQVEFKIGVDRMYVLKDIFAFTRCMQENQEFAYGQKLQFIHVPEAFTPQSRKIVGFLREWAMCNGSRYIQSSYQSYSYTNAYPKLRSIPLTGSELESLLEAIGDEKFQAQIGNGPEQDWQVTEGKPARELVIAGDNEGIELKLSCPYGVTGSEHQIYFENGKVYLVPLHANQMEEQTAWSFANCLEQLPGNRAFIKTSDVPMFGRELLPVLEKEFLCKKENFQEESYGIFKAAYEIYLDAPQKNLISGKILAVYGEQKYNIFDQTENRDVRDLLGEEEIRELLSGYFNAYDEERQELILSEDEEKLYALLTDGIGRMQDYGEVYITDALKRIKVLDTPKVKVGVSISSGVLNLDVTAGDMDREELMEILSKYDRKKKFYRLKNGSFLNMEEEQLEVLMDLKAGLHLTPKQLRQAQIQVPAFRALYLDEKLNECQGMSTVRDKQFRILIKNMKNAKENEFEISKEQESVLREYQKQGFLWMKTLRQNQFGGILADDMGLGKTLQVITFLWSEFLEAKEGENHKCLIVTPASLVYNWYSEIEKFAPGLPVTLVTGTAGEREELLKKVGEKDILITSYDLLRRDIEEYENLKFACEIIDEAQYIKNHGTQAARAVKDVEAEFKMALTGTPVENRLSELWSIFDYLMPGFLYGYEQFRKELELPIVQENEEKAALRLQKMIRPFILRRMKKDVLKDLPDKIEKDMFSRMEGEQQKLYDAHVKRLKMMLGSQSDAEFRMSKIQVLAEMTKLRQICCHPALLYEDYQASSAKMEMCMELIENAVNGGHKILLFSQFTSMLEILIQQLAKRDISYYTLTGATPKEKRSELVQAFNQDDTSVFCISLKAGGTGLNLTAADIVIHYDPWWNLAVQNQATDRAHRIGQENVVSVYRLFAKGTIEEKIRELQEQKRELASQILSGEGMDSGKMSKEEILEILREQGN